MAANLARRHTIINLTKWSLPFAAALLLAAIALWPEVISRQKSSPPLTGGSAGAGSSSGFLQLARYNGIDQQGQPYTVTAKSVRQPMPDEVRLSTPRGEIALENGQWVLASSRNGLYYQSSEQLELNQDVVFYRDDGTTLLTDNLIVDLRTNSAASSDAVHVEGPFGAIDAKGVTISGGGAAVDFGGPARLTLRGDR